MADCPHVTEDKPGKGCPLLSQRVQVLLTIEGGAVVRQQLLHPDEMAMSPVCFTELARSAGRTIIPPCANAEEYAMTEKNTGFTASGLSHPDDGDTVGENIRQQAAVTTSLIEFMARAFDPEDPKQRRLLWDLLTVATERAQALTSALDGVEIRLPAGKMPPFPPGGPGHA